MHKEVRANLKEAVELYIESFVKRNLTMNWCDLSCEYASFPEVQAVDGAGSCRTFAALYCAKLKRLVHKNGPCPGESETGPGATEAGPTASSEA